MTERRPVPAAQLFGVVYSEWAIGLAELMFFSPARLVLEQLRVQLDHPYDRYPTDR